VRILAGLFLALASPALAGCDPEDPFGLYPHEPDEIIAPLKLTGRVVDAADILDEATEARLTEQLAKLEQDVGPQLVVVSTPDLKGLDIADYSLALGRGWGIGSADRDDGLLLVVAPNERKIRIEVGYGLEDTLSDPLCKDIIVNDIVPSFRERNFSDGISKGVARLDYELRTRLQKRAA
jgi:uncharacterized protein